LPKSAKGKGDPGPGKRKKERKPSFSHSEEREEGPFVAGVIPKGVRGFLYSRIASNARNVREEEERNLSLVQM